MNIARQTKRLPTGMFWVLVILIFLFPNETVTPKPFTSWRLVSTHGTLIVYVPSKDGLVVAADSRYMTSEMSYCDYAEKIIPLVKHPRAVVANTGFSEIQGLPTEDPCTYAKTHPPKLSIGMLARDFLDARDGDIGRKLLKFRAPTAEPTTGLARST